MPNPQAVRVGPGWLYLAPLGTTEPTDLTTDWDPGWTEVGYTEEGHTFSHELSVEPIEVAETLYPIRYEATGVEMMVSFQMAEITASNIQTALNGGTIALSGAGSGQYANFEPPDLGDETRIMLGWEHNDGKERFLWRQCIQSGAAEMNRAKAPDKTLIPGEFRVETPFDPATGQAGKPWKALISQPA